MVYDFKKNSRFSVPAQVAGEELERIRADHGIPTTDGLIGLPANVVVDESRPGDAPLHPVFEWDDWEAAERYREDQARALIRSVYVVSPADGPEPPRSSHAYVSVGDPIKGGSSYVPVAEAMRSEIHRERVLSDLRAMIKAWHARFLDLSQDDRETAFADLSRLLASIKRKLKTEVSA